jgi:hypothetical protein
MSMSDWMDDEPPVDLPPDAGTEGRKGFEPNDEWVKSAEQEIQREVLRRWFLTRYWDPANDTPYDSGEGGYIYIWGGPYEAGDELHGRFCGVVPEEVIDEVVEDLQRDGIYDWAPIHTEPDYDEAFEFSVVFRGAPYCNVSTKLAEFDELRAINPGMRLQPAMRQLLYSSLIAALEAYLAETLSYWVSADKGVVRKIVEHSKEFREKKLAVSQIFERLDALSEEVEKHLQALVWHRLDIVGPLIGASLEVEIPEIGPLMKRILVRHDIVHRGGRTKDGKMVNVTDADLDGLRAEVADFTNSIEQRIDAIRPVAQEIINF